MSVSSSAQKQAGVSSNRPTYLKSFLEDAHRLVFMGYELIKPEEQEKTKEEDITEMIANAINELVEDRKAARWMRRYMAIDDRRLTAPRRPGKKRPRVDIEIILLRHSPRPRFHFEAKRLYRSDSVSAYLGAEGLGCFLNAEYARDSDEAGMLGYVQAGDCDTWAEKIRASIEEDAAKYGLVKDKSWRTATIIDELKNCYQSDHERPNLGRLVCVTHTLLLFRGAGAVRRGLDSRRTI